MPSALSTDHTLPASTAVTSRASAAFVTLHALSWIAAAAQSLIDPDYVNLACTLMVLASASCTLLYMRLTRALHEVPLSTVAVFGLCLTTQWGAMFWQSLQWNSLTANLRVPLQTFGYLLGFQLVALLAHWVSRQLSLFVAARRVGADLLEPLGVFRVPAVQSIWVIGGFGLLCALLERLSAGGLAGKVAAGFSVFAWAPFTIPLLYGRLGSAYCRIARQLPFLGLFVGLAVLLGLAVNARAIMLVGAMTGLLLFLVRVLDDERPFRLGQLRYVVAPIVVFALLYEPMGYFFTAVQVARSERGKISQLEMISHTWETLKKPDEVRREKEKAQISAAVEVYDEYYFKSAMIGRLVETKFHDNSFFMVEGVSPRESAMVAEDAFDRVISILPYPLLKSIGFERSKFVTMYSAGDLLAHLRLGVELGAFRTGSMFAQGIAIFGVWAPFLYFLMCIPMFIAWDMLSRPGRPGVAPVISVVAMLLMYKLFAYGIVAESFGTLIGTLVRFQLQNVVLFGLAYAVTRAIWKPFDPHAVRPVDGRA